MLTGPSPATSTRAHNALVKLPRDPDALRLPANRALVFATPDEFRNHHKED
jgi:hypothetical protein